MPGLPTAPGGDFQPPFGQTPISQQPLKGKIPLIGGPIVVDPDEFIPNPIITILTGYLQPGALKTVVDSAYALDPESMDKLGIQNEGDFLRFANSLLRWIPHENSEGKDVYDVLCMFYWVFNQPPLINLQTPIHPDSVGEPLTWLSSWIVVYCQLIGAWMDTPASMTEKSLNSFKRAANYRYGEALVPPCGFRTFNEFFARKLKPGARPIAEPADDRVIVYPADCHFDDNQADGSIVNIETGGFVTIKGLQWTISSLLQGSKYAGEFDNGVWMHAFLNAFNYHREHAPVSGTVVEAGNIQGAAYLEVDEKGRQLRAIEAPDNPGYQFLQTRGLVIIDNPKLGLVAVLPIGMAMVSSVKLTVREGDIVKKGDEISYFEFGGSDIICVFQAKAGLSFDDFVRSPPGDDDYSQMGTVLARAPLPE
ncbi:phosphatidylserine decarboxylase-domain-containing protein [Hypoxylon crocopeplum]|nr:phosphatidylserine decarboxylase-domain-containing protein [Hypoxylon crocopeplum]